MRGSLAALLLLAVSLPLECGGDEEPEEPAEGEEDGDSDSAPFMIVVEHQRTHNSAVGAWHCSGSLVSTRTGVTSAECARGPPQPAPLDLWALSAACATGVVPRIHGARRVARVATATTTGQSPEGEGGTWELAVLELAEPFSSAAHARPILMATSPQECSESGIVCHVVRALWVARDDDPDEPGRARLRIEDAQLAGPGICAAAIPRWAVLHERGLCLEGPELCAAERGAGVVCGGKLCGVLARSAPTPPAPRPRAPCGPVHAAHSVPRWRRFLHCAHTLRSCGRGTCAEICSERRLLDIEGEGEEARVPTPTTTRLITRATLTTDDWASVRSQPLVEGPEEEVEEQPALQPTRVKVATAARRRPATSTLPRSRPRPSSRGPTRSIPRTTTTTPVPPPALPPPPRVPAAPTMLRRLPTSRRTRARKRFNRKQMQATNLPTPPPPPPIPSTPAPHPLVPPTTDPPPTASPPTDPPNTAPAPTLTTLPEVTRSSPPLLSTITTTTTSLPTSLTPALTTEAPHPKPPPPVSLRPTPLFEPNRPDFRAGEYGDNAADYDSEDIGGGGGGGGGGGDVGPTVGGGGLVFTSTTERAPPPAKPRAAPPARGGPKRAGGQSGVLVVPPVFLPLETEAPEDENTVEPHREVGNALDFAHLLTPTLSARSNFCLYILFTVFIL